MGHYLPPGFMAAKQDALIKLANIYNEKQKRFSFIKKYTI